MWSLSGRSECSERERTHWAATSTPASGRVASNASAHSGTPSREHLLSAVPAYHHWSVSATDARTCAVRPPPQSLRGVPARLPIAPDGAYLRTFVRLVREWRVGGGGKGGRDEPQ